MLKLSGITKSYAGLPVLSDLSLTLSPGEIVALSGPLRLRKDHAS